MTLPCLSTLKLALWLELIVWINTMCMWDTVTPEYLDFDSNNSPMLFILNRATQPAIKRATCQLSMGLHCSSLVLTHFPPFLIKSTTSQHSSALPTNNGAYPDEPASSLTPKSPPTGSLTPSGEKPSL